ncbi:hypothetical protein NFC73_11555 [Pseudarthrobacter sp. RMG13]|uniref:Secreted protein n=1 Tax=Pseudarthrobacter humi TaxID=2952523 RepID=A0ABT1LRR0_9MICC|nr:hypothetical protein [Pseudarthrobacter humi]MCP9000358.1 hypothetical protein [Pseudarthrobacter humi]
MKKALVKFWHWKHWPVILGSAAILLGIVVVVASTSSFMQGPTAVQPPNAAEWLSAISTFWGAIATAVGAIVTAGAVLIAALTYKHQVDEKNREAEDRRQQDKEKRRAQARAVRLAVSPRDGDRFDCDLNNYGDLPVSVVNVVSVNAAGEETARRDVGLLIRNVPRRAMVPDHAVPSTSYVSFRDTEGLSWKLYFDDRLEEQVPAEAVAP